MLLGAHWTERAREPERTCFDLPFDGSERPEIETRAAGGAPFLDSAGLEGLDPRESLSIY